MVKMKDFTLASKNLEGARAPVPYSTPAHDYTSTYLYEDIRVFMYSVIK